MFSASEGRRTIGHMEVSVRYIQPQGSRLISKPPGLEQVHDGIEHSLESGCARHRTTVHDGADAGLGGPMRPYIPVMQALVSDTDALYNIWWTGRMGTIAT
jgi:hypothetical protein